MRLESWKCMLLKHYRLNGFEINYFNQFKTLCCNLFIQFNDKLKLNATETVIT